MHSLSLKGKIFFITWFAIAMGFLETAVVVYLRALYYPEGFVFPLIPMDPNIIGVELIRELSTIVMLVCIGILAGEKPLEKFSWFLFTFGVWDIIYYVGLKLFLDWPPSLLTWDVLFLLPVTWAGPVLAPLLCSLMMIGFALFTLMSRQKNPLMMPGKLSWLMISSGALVVFISFIADYAIFMVQSGNLQKGSKIWNLGFTDDIIRFIPDKFHWIFFVTGYLLILSGIVVYDIRVRRNKLGPVNHTQHK